jgi:2-C-methyl-D-erythritol 4-phosphate cytidylyltransferase
MPNLCVILVAAGKSSRFQNPQTKKPFVNLAGRPVWLHSAHRFRQHDSVNQLILVLAAEDRDTFLEANAKLVTDLNITVVIGGAERADSVENALQPVDSMCDFVVIHDAARPCFEMNLFERVLASALTQGAAIPAIPIHSTIKRSTDSRCVNQTVDRTNLYLAQTPQIFRKQWIVEAYRKRPRGLLTDDAQLLELADYPISLVEGSPLNIKITTTQDVILAEAIWQIQQTSNR